MDKKINRYFCIQPFVNTTTRIQGQNNVCCNINNFDSTIDRQSPGEFFHSDRVKNMREKMLKGIKLDECSLCHYQEKMVNNSHRIEYNKYYNIKNDQPNEYYNKILKKLRLSDLDNPLYAELHISNLCNLKCLTCNERDSSKFHAENKLLGISDEPDVEYSDFDINKYKALDSVIKRGLLFLDIRGGETLMVPEVKKILTEVDADMAKNITLKIQTNGTIEPDKNWIAIFKKFKRTKVNLSIDAFGEDNHYVRFPSDWKKILYTVDVLKTNDIKFIVNTVVSNINLLLLDKLFAWIQENKYLNYFYILESPEHYRPTNLPQSLLDIAAKRLQNVSKDFVNKDCHQKLDDLIEMCKTSCADTSWQNFCKEIQMRDKYRQNTITNIIPEIKEYMNAEI
jgi:molybdenum cofactor biosynthesis enzyme MoaA|tara:strand:- start:418 stop:1605 length:1188 start_codon:yes stop_codon:yes gene_type:complete